jgi:hypothetical protein
VVVIGDGEDVLFSPSWAVTKGGGGDKQGWWWVGRGEWPCLVAK